MLNHFHSKLNRHNFQIKFGHYRLMMRHLIKRYVPGKYLERRNVENTKLSDASLLALMCLKVQYRVATWKLWEYYKLATNVG